MATVRLGTAPKIAWGFPFLVCREQGSSMGAGTRLPLFATQGGGGEEAGKVSNPRQNPRNCGRARLPRSPPPCFHGMERASFFLRDWQSPTWGWPEATVCTQRPFTPPATQARDVPWASGPTDQHSLLHSLTNICSGPSGAKLLHPSRGNNKATPQRESTTGLKGPTGRRGGARSAPARPQ